ncbi:MAG: efflux RND transporter periplasmic adaptor subunit [Gammaproteobacteria bacterium]|nr:efflux RND transporter periplasmic adaptor subunit [Gammaproteobacteria bacterium]
MANFLNLTKTSPRVSGLTQGIAMSVRSTLMLVLTAFASSSVAQTAPVHAVSVAPVQQQQVSPNMMVSGQVYSRFQSNLSTGVDGRLDWIIEPGQQVIQGDLLAKLDLKPLQLQSAELQAQQKRAAIQVNRMQKELARLQSLVAKSLISQTQLDQQQADYDLAVADLELSKAALAQIQDQLQRAELKAPFAGVVSQRHHQVGEEISRNAPLLQLVSLGELEVRVFAPLQFAAFIKKGESLRVFTPAGEQQLQVQSMIPVSDVRSQTYELRLVVPEGQASVFQVGQLVTVAIPTAKAELSLVVHRDALVLGKDQHHVFKLNADKAVKVPVTLGQGQGEWIQVEGALRSNDQLVVRGADTLNDGDAVKVLSADEFKLAQQR